MLTRSKRFAASLAASALLTSLTPVFASPIPVVDSSNIAQQAKTYAETVKVVTETAKQVELRLKELQALPQSTLDRFEKDFNDAVDKLNKNLETHLGVVGNKNAASNQAITNFLNKSIPGIAGNTGITTGDVVTIPNMPISTTQERLQTASLLAKSFLSQSNIEALTKVQGYITQVSEAQGELAKLIKLSGESVGAKQSAQIANQISAVKARIDSANTVINAITGQQQILKTQTEIQEKKNDAAAAKANAAAEEATMKKIVEESGNVVAKNANPWKKYVTWDVLK